MKALYNDRFSIVFITIISLFLCSCGYEDVAVKSQTANQTNILSTSPTPVVDISEQQMSKGVLPKREVLNLRCKELSQDCAVNFKNISFIVNRAIAEQVVVTEHQESPLKDANRKPDFVNPSYLSFEFHGNYAIEHKESFYAPSRISIYPIDEYRRMFAASERETQNFSNQISKLKNILLKMPKNTEEEIPFLTFSEGFQAFRSKIKFNSFKNGKGVFLLTQYTSEPSIINNQELFYAFQGFSDDGEYYVLAIFPVRVSFLPNDNKVNEVEDYKLPYASFDLDGISENSRSYKKYIAEIKAKLDRMPNDNFHPNLSYFEELMSTLTVR